MGRLIKLVGMGIGLAAEARANRRASSEVSSFFSRAENSETLNRRSSDDPPEYVEVEDDRAAELIANGQAVSVYPRRSISRNDFYRDIDEEQWELDDAIDDSITRSTTIEEERGRDERKIIGDFLSRHPTPAYNPAYMARSRLQYPVIIPQRRPREKKRGFIRAYAPVLSDFGIDQTTFLDFLKTFHQASKASPWLTVVNIAAAATGFAPSLIAMGVSMAVQFSVGVAIAVQSRARTNTFLDRINDAFFRPRGLCCLIMTYKPDTPSVFSKMDILKTMSTSLAPSSASLGKHFQNLRTSSGKTYGELELPESAPLIFPDLDELATSDDKEGGEKQTKLKRSQKFVTEYLDRRAQASYAAENSESTLASTPSTSFASRYFNPNHPGNSGSLIALAAGGLVDPNGIRAALKGESGSVARREREGVVRRYLKDVLYLMVVNMPSEEELMEGRRAVDREGWR